MATAVAIATQRWRIPYTAALLLVGVGLRSLHIVELPDLTQELLFALFLLGCCSRLRIIWKCMSCGESAWEITALAVPGVVIAISITAALHTAGAAVFGASDAAG